MPRIAAAVGRKLGYYVYLYVDPTDGSVFYVGKGKNGRALAHLRADERKAITKGIRKIRAASQEPQIEILAHGLDSADTALKVEAAAIDLLGGLRLSGASVHKLRRGWFEATQQAFQGNRPDPSRVL